MPRAALGTVGSPTTGRSLVLVAVAACYAVAVVAAEWILARGDGRVGVLAIAVILMWATVRASSAAWSAMIPGSIDVDRRLRARWYAALALVPLLRLVALALPFDGRSMVFRAVIMLPAVLGAGAMVVRASGYRWREVGIWLNWSWRGLPLDLVVAAAGVGLGYVQYRFWAPMPLVDTLTPSISLGLVVAGLGAIAAAEEFIYRGLIQTATGDLLGIPFAVILGATLFAAPQVGRGAAFTDDLTFVVAAVLGVGFALTRSLLGAALSRTVSYICLLIVFPLWL